MSFSVTASINGRQHSVGESSTEEAGRRCALSINPNCDPVTEAIKVFHAAAMERVIRARNAIPRPADDATSSEKAAYGDAMRCFATALTHLETAQMFAVKGLHTRSNAGVPKKPEDNNLDTDPS